jgi:serine/threonine protein kinase/tetratricopeptide (TPR) repeat protein
MSDDPRLPDLLLRYEELIAQGQKATPEALCRDCPELLPEFRRRLDALTRLDEDLLTQSISPIGRWSDGGNVALAGPEQPADVPDHPEFGNLEDAPRISGYRIVAEIAQGGMGRVYAAHDETLDREVAIKTLLPGADAGRFLREAKITAKLPHPAIPPVYALGKLPDGTPWLAMKLIRGQTLEDILIHRKSLSPFATCQGTGTRSDLPSDLSRLLQIFEQICQAVGFAHCRGIVHRDLKPLNVMVGEFGEVQIMDWGLAKQMPPELLQPARDSTVLPASSRVFQEIEDHLVAAAAAQQRTAPGTVLGTPGYMAPEQARGEFSDQRADVFALGSILAAILTGSPAFVGRSKWETILKSRQADLSDVMSRLDACGADGDLIAIAKRCLSARPEERPADGQAVAKAIADYRASVEQRLRQVETERTRAETQAAEQRKRQRVVQGAGTVAGALLLLGIVGTTIGLLRANDAAHKERMANLAAHEEKQKAEQAARAESEARMAAQRAAEAEKLARELTQRRLAQIEKGVELLAGMLRGINPRLEEQGGDPLYVQLRKRTEKTADVLVGESVGDPVAVARLQTILGDTLRELGNTSKAVEVLEKARDTCERELGADHLDTLATLNHLAEAYHDAGRLDESIALYDKVRAGRITKLGLDHPDTLTTLNNLAGAYRLAGRLNEAIALYEQVRKARIAKLGAEHPDTLATLNNLAGAYRAAGRLPEAIALFEQVRTVKTAKLGPDHYSTLMTLNNLALAYQTAGRLGEAITLYEQVRHAKVQKLGADHPSTLTTLNNLALAYYLAGRLEEAIALFEQVRTAQAIKLGADHPTTLITLNNLALAYQQSGKLEEAIALFEQVRAAQAARSGADHPSTLRTLNNLAVALQAAGRHAEAISMLEEVRTLQAARLGPDHPDTLSTLHNLAGAHQAASRQDEAIALYEQVLKARIAKLGAEHPDTLTTLNNLAGTYQAANRLDEAISLYEQVRTMRIAKLGAEHPDTLTTLNNLAGAYHAAGRLREAIALYEQAAVGLEKRRFQHPHAAALVSNLARTCEEANDYRRAETWRRKWLEHVQEQVGSQHPACAGELAALGWLALKQEKWIEAESLLRQALAILEKDPEADRTGYPWRLFNTMSLLGKALLGQARNTDDPAEKLLLLAEAELLLVQGFQGMESQRERIPPERHVCIPEALDRVIEFYVAVDKPDEAHKFRQLRSQLVKDK